MKKVLLTMLITGVILLTSGCGKQITEITYQDYQRRLKDKETFILEITQTGCSSCEDFSPRFKALVKQENLANVYQLNLSDMSKKEVNELEEATGITVTPTVLFYKEGKQHSDIYKIEGAASDKEVRDILKNLDYIK